MGRSGTDAGATGVVSKRQKSNKFMGNRDGEVHIDVVLRMWEELKVGSDPERSLLYGWMTGQFFADLERQEQEKVCYLAHIYPYPSKLKYMENYPFSWCPEIEKILDKKFCKELHELEETGNMDGMLHLVRSFRKAGCRAETLYLSISYLVVPTTLWLVPPFSVGYVGSDVLAFVILMCEAEADKNLTPNDVAVAWKWTGHLCHPGSSNAADFAAKNEDWVAQLCGKDSNSATVFSCYDGLATLLKKKLSGWTWRELLLSTLYEFVEHSEFLPSLKTKAASWRDIESESERSNRYRPANILNFLRELSDLQNAQHPEVRLRLLNASSTETNAHCDECQAKIESLQATYQTTTRELHTKAKALEIQNANAKREHETEMEDLRAAAEAETIALQQEIHCLEARNEECQQQLVLHENTIETLRATILELERDNNLLTAQRSKHDETVETLVATVQTLGSKIDTWTARLVEPEREGAMPIDREDEVEYFRIHTPSDSAAVGSAFDGLPQVGSLGSLTASDSRSVAIEAALEGVPVARPAPRSIASDDANDNASDSVSELNDVTTIGELLTTAPECCDADVAPPTVCECDSNDNCPAPEFSAEARLTTTVPASLAQTDVDDHDVATDTVTANIIDALPPSENALHPSDMPDSVRDNDPGDADSDHSSSSGVLIPTPDSWFMPDSVMIHPDMQRMVKLSGFQKPLPLAEMREVVNKISAATNTKVVHATNPWLGVDAVHYGNNQIHWTGTAANAIETVTFDFSQQKPVFGRLSCSVLLRDPVQANLLRQTLQNDSRLRRVRVDVTDLFLRALNNPENVQKVVELDQALRGTKWQRDEAADGNVWWTVGVRKRDTVILALDLLRSGLETSTTEQRAAFLGDFYDEVWGDVKTLTRHRSQTFVFAAPDGNEFPNLHLVTGVCYEMKPFQVQL